MTTSPEHWRRATVADALALTELERDANLIALAHVFGDLPYPVDDVLARWTLVLADPSVTVEVLGDFTALVAHDGVSLRHLAVHPSSWGRGLGATGVSRAVAAGARQLWVLEENVVARRLYERLGWAPSGARQDCPFPPFPVELDYVLRSGVFVSPADR